VTEPQMLSAGEAVRFLAQQAVEKFTTEAEAVGALALKDAGLLREDGWRFDIFQAVFVQVPQSATAATE